MSHKVPNHILIPEIARLLQAGQQVVFTPSGASMRPFIEGDRDSVVLSRADTLRVGDILLCRIGGSYVLHRLIAIDGEQLTLMGDGNLCGEEHCTRADVLGRVTEIRTPGGRRKRLTRGRLWHRMLPLRPILLKIYRKWLRIINC